MKKTLLLGLLFMVIPITIICQTAPIVGLQKEIPSVYFLKNADVIVSPEREIKKANIVVRGAFIEAVGKNLKCPADAVVIDLSGKKVYPGFIEMYAQLGFGAKWDKNGKGDDLTHWNFSVNTETPRDLFLHASEADIDNYRKAGFTTVQSFSDTRLFSGNASLLLLNDKKITKRSILKYRYGQLINTKMHGLPSIKDARSYPTSFQGSISLIRQTLYDALWYDKLKAVENGKSIFDERYEMDLSLEALSKSLNENDPFYLVATDENDVNRIQKIANEFSLNYYVIGSGLEYRRLKDVKKSNAKLILPIKSAFKQNVNSVHDFGDRKLGDLKHLALADRNPSMLDEAEIPFVLSSKNFNGLTPFLKNLRNVVKAGLDKKTALAALTTKPALWLNIEDKAGSIKSGKLANFFIADNDIFEDGSKIMETWVSGNRFIYNKMNDFGGTFKVKISGLHDPENLQLSFKLKNNTLSGTYEFSDTLKGSISKTRFHNDLLTFQLKGEGDAIIRFYGHRVKDEIMGYGLTEDGKRFNWNAFLVEKQQKEEHKKTDKKEKDKLSPKLFYPEGIFGFEEFATEKNAVLIKNATVWTAADKGVLKNTDMLVMDGKIAEIGQGIKAPRLANVIDATGKHISPGIIDPHSHIAVESGINEVSFSVIPEVRIEDVVDPDDIDIYYQLAGGLTSSCLLHGSANPIGGLSAVIKLKWGRNADDLIIDNAPEIMKFALGENVKSPGSSVGKSRYPQSRMGTIEIVRDAFNRALDYRKEWAYYEKNKANDRNILPPRKILKYDYLLDVIDGKTLIHCHAYRHDEIIAFLRVCEEFGITVKAFIHTVEGYKVAKELREHGAGAIVFSDWWGYKMEAYDGIPYNAALLIENGVITAVHSDNPDHARRLNTEAAKSMYYGGVSEEEAIKLATINAAKMLGLDERIGSLEVGKDADFVIWSHSPLSSMTKCEQTWIEGVRYFDLETDQKLRHRDQKLKLELIKDYSTN